MTRPKEEEAEGVPADFTEPLEALYVTEVGGGGRDVYRGCMFHRSNLICLCSVCGRVAHTVGYYISCRRGYESIGGTYWSELMGVVCIPL
jgi:hypothetical protein